MDPNSVLGGNAEISHDFPQHVAPVPTPRMLQLNAAMNVRFKDAKVDTDVERDTSKDGTRLEVKRLDKVYNPRTCAWTRRESEIQKPTPISTVNEHAEFAFIVLREFKPTADPAVNVIVTTYEIQSAQLRKIGQEVIGRELGISWTMSTVTVEPQTLMAFLPQLEEHLELLRSKHTAEDDLSTEIEHLTFLLEFINTEHASTLKEIKALLANDEITYDLAWVLYVPRTVLYTLCPVSNTPRAVRLIKATKGLLWSLEAEYTEFHGREPRFGLAPLNLSVSYFQGAVKISSLSAYPLKYHPNVEGVTASLVERGKKWCGLQGVYLKYYNAMAFQCKNRIYFKRHTQSRIVIDKKTFDQINPNYGLPAIAKTLAGEKLEPNVQGEEMTVGMDGQPVAQPVRGVRTAGRLVQRARTVQLQLSQEDNHFNATPAITDDFDPENPPWKDLKDDDLLLASPLVYGFSLAEKLWLEFSVEDIQTFSWNDEPFTNLVLARDQKSLILSLVESHMHRTSKHFDDFVQGKGQGLVINLFGNPGIGKSLTAEATSEHVRKPLYIVGAGDLGITPQLLDATLTTIFTVSSRWGAVVLIDEADVFLEERSLHDLTRNAMVAVFLRQLEYFRGILFLTTNRVRTFDRAFQSRIHVSLRYRDLTPDAKRQIWTAFLKKAVAGSLDLESAGSSASDISKLATPIGLTDEELGQLAQKPVNGRQIKNAVLTAGALALARKQPLGFGHLIEVLDMIEQFDATDEATEGA
ncbi:P-loop containing nucleoside triphosphate hydrolase protein [Schizopora paradoxa]|uniref:p-loop containing nucleoside triphosphate hydrolase protein n=1 Tax=Schizopora paradoxa TaxID=27342 RepID=A0A0H2RQJ8_9AGAM|nr:P-loop containing nucleoside triphosphate hydrolase protein [Schizopora paradoxa]